MQKGILIKLGLWLVVVVLVVEVAAIFKPLPKGISYQAGHSIPSSSVSLLWPSAGQSAVGALDYGVLATSGAQTPMPIASVAKVITALAVLKQKPLAPGQDGPLITLGQDDVNNYQSFVSQDGSVVPVAVGEQLSERKALEAMLLPSANNIAYSLANWAFGSLTAYTSYANKFVKSLGLNSTVVADASGFSPKTVSSASDLTTIALEVLKNPILTSIVGETNATIPVAGTVSNTNWLLGNDGIVGIKTGNTEQAGGCFLFAAKHQVQGQNLTIVGAVLNQPSLRLAMTDARSLLSSVDNNFQLVKIAVPGQSFGWYDTVWGSTISLVAKNQLSVLLWRSQKLNLDVQLRIPAPGSPAGTDAGMLIAKTASQKLSVPLVTNRTLLKPSLSWRLTHP